MKRTKSVRKEKKNTKRKNRLLVNLKNMDEEKETTSEVSGTDTFSFDEGTKTVTAGPIVPDNGVPDEYYKDFV